MKIRRLCALALAAFLPLAALPLPAMAEDAPAGPAPTLTAELSGLAPVQGQEATVTLTAHAADGTPLEGEYPVSLSGCGGYTRKGLVLWYDAIDNTGTGRHDENARTWVDLSGNGYDGVLQGNLQWEADRLRWGIADNSHRVNIPALPVTGDYTVEFCYSKTGSAAALPLLYDSTNLNARLSLRYSGGGGTADNGFGGTVDSRAFSGYQPGNIAFAASGFTEDMTAEKGVWQGGAQKLSGLRQAALFPVTPLWLGAGSPNSSVNKSFSSVRIYNRALSEQELKGNFTYDRARFGLSEMDENAPAVDYDPGIGRFNGLPISHTGLTGTTASFHDGVAQLPLTLGQPGVYNLVFTVTVGDEEASGGLGEIGVGQPGAPQSSAVSLQRPDGTEVQPGESAAEYGYSAAQAPTVRLTTDAAVGDRYEWYRNAQPSRQGSVLIGTTGQPSLALEDFPVGVTYVYCKAVRTVSGAEAASLSPLIAVRIGSGGKVSVTANFAAGLDGPGTAARLYAYGNSTLDDGSGEQSLGAYYGVTPDGPSLPNGGAAVSGETLHNQDFYVYAASGTDWGAGFWQYTGLAEGWLPQLRYNSTSPLFPYQEGRDASGEYHFPPSGPGDTPKGGVAIPSEENGWPALPSPTAAVEAVGYAAASLRMMVRALPDGGLEPETYPSGADSVNVEFGSPDPAASFTISDGVRTLGPFPVDRRVFTFGYGFAAPLTVTVTGRGGQAQPYTFRAEELRRKVLAWGEHWYYLADNGVQSDAGLLPGSFAHLYGGLALDEAGVLHDLANDGAQAGKAGPLALRETARPLWHFGYEGYEIETYRGFSVIRGEEGTVEREWQLFVKDGVLSALDPALPIISGGVVTDRALGLDYLSTLGTDGAISDLKEAVKKPEGFRNTGIAQMTDNLGCTRPWVLVRYADGSTAGFNYLTGEALPIKTAPSDSSFLRYAKGYFQAKKPPVMEGATAGYLEIKELEDYLTVYPYAEDIPVNEALSDGSGEIVTGDHPPLREAGGSRPEAGTEPPGAGGAGSSSADGSAEDGSGADTAEADGGKERPEKPITGNSGAESASADGGGQASSAAAAGRAGNGTTSGGGRPEGRTAPGKPAEHRYLVVYSAADSRYVLYDEREALARPGEHIQPLSKLLESTGALEELRQSEQPRDTARGNTGGIVLFGGTAAAIVLLLGLLCRKRKPAAESSADAPRKGGQDGER